MSTSLTTVSVEMWDEQQAEIERLRAENAKLLADKDVIRSQERNAAYESDIDQLEAENAKLRAALEQARTLIIGAPLHFNWQIGPFRPQEDWQKSANKFIAALNEETK